MGKQSLRKPLFAGLWLTASCFAPTSYSQVDPVAEPVVVSASRRPELLWETPSALELISRHQLDGAGPRIQAAESLQRLPGIVAADRGNFAQDPQLAVRGFGARAAFGVRGIRLVGDGIPASIPDGQGQASSFALSSADRIEVLRGPMAVLYGNASGALIQTFTRSPDPGLALQAQAYTGALGLKRASVQTEYQAEGAEVLVDYNDFSIDGYRINSAASRQQLQGIYRYKWSESTHLRLVAQRWDQPYAQDPAGLNLQQLQMNPRQAGTNTVERRVRKETSQDQLGLSLEHRVTQHLELNLYSFAGTRDNLQYLSSNSWIGLDRSYDGLGLRMTQRSDLATVPVQWSLSFERERSAERRQAGAALVGEKQGEVTRNEHQRAVSTQAVWIAHAYLSERYVIYGGVRHGHVRLSAQDYYLEDGQDGTGAVRYQQTSPVIGIQHWLSRDQQIFLSTGKGYETPTLAEVSYISDSRTSSSILPRFNTQMAASSNRQWELGWRGRSADRHRWTLIGFHVQSDNEIVVDRATAGQNSFRNAPGTERYGLEFSWTAKWSANWQSYFSLNKMRALYQGPWTVAGQSLDGRWMPATPDTAGFAELSYQQGEQVSAIEIRHLGRRFANDLNTLSAPSFHTWAIRWQRALIIGANRLTAMARIDNLLNRRYVGSVIVNSISPFEPSPGRTAWVGLRLRLPML